MSNQVKVVSIEKAEVFPINSMSSFSFKNGSPIINFEIAPTPNKLIDTSTMRLNFKIRCGYGSGANFLRVNNQATYGPIGNVARGQAAGSMNSRVGVVSVIDNIKLSNFKNEVIEEIRNYSRLNASVIPCLNSFQRYKNSLSNVYYGFGNQVAQQLRNNSDMNCSIPIRAGVLQSGQPLDIQSMGGLKMDINLSPDSFVFNVSDADNYTGGTTNYGDGRVYYELSEVSLNFNYLVLNQPIPPKNEVIPYSAYNSYLQVIHSSDNQNTLNLALSSVRSVFQNFLPSPNINNYLVDSLQTTPLRNKGANNYAVAEDRVIRELTHLRNGVKYPKQYSIDERNVVSRASAIPAHQLRDFLNGIKSFNLITSTLISPATQASKTRDDDDYDQPDGKNNGYEIYGTASRYDALNMGSGAEFMNSGYTVRLLSDLDGGSPNNAYTFTLSNQGLGVKNMGVNPVM